MEGWQIWDLVKRMGRQVRVGGMGGLIGFDLAVAFPMGAALGLPAYLVAEFLPEIEDAVMAALSNKGGADDE